jgi:hypothetical protein
MRSYEFLNERRLDPELLRMYNLAKARFPMYDQETALLKYLQVSSNRSDSEDAKETAAIKRLEKEVKDLDRRVNNIEKKDVKDLDRRVKSLEKSKK